ncbi:MAG: hypothetical protein WCD12_13460 [Candidatus Binatus sp.]|uniref:hypothetical protein n=1 Tax=Candidatus Binatus sp. TaxID=2811406 RepID=UPI003C776399
MEYRLLDAFRRAFEGKPYLHRNSSIGDRIAQFLYEDLVQLGTSKTLVSRVKSGEVALNSRNLRVGIKARRGDGTFGERVPGTKLIHDKGFDVPRGQIATVEIGAEVKVIAKSMIKQFDRVKRDLTGQVAEFKTGGGTPICVGIVGINWAASYHSFEGEKEYDTKGTSKEPHPIKDAHKTGVRLEHEAKPAFDEFLILRFRATNVEPFPFEWVDESATTTAYGALLIRVSRKYEQLFGEK